MLVLLAVLALASVVAQYAHGVLLDTDRYVATVEPLASNSVVQSEISDRIAAEVMARLNIEAVTVDALEALADTVPRLPASVVALAPVVAEQTESLVRRTAEGIVESDGFAALWTGANMRAHGALVAVVTGANGRIDDDGTVRVSLAPVVDRVRDALTERGFDAAGSIPDTDASLVLVELPRVASAQRLASALDTASTVLPWLTALVAGLLVWIGPAGRRWRAVSRAGGTVGLAMVVLAIALALGRSSYLAHVSGSAVSPDLAAVVFDSLAVPLRTSLRAVFLLGLVIAAVGYVNGSSASAAALRSACSRAFGTLRHAEPSAPSDAAARWRTPLRVVVCGAAALTLVFWDYPSGAAVLTVVLAAVVCLVVVEVVAHPSVSSERQTP